MKPPATLQEIGSQVREARMRSRLTQADLASASGLSRSTLNGLERGTIEELGWNKVRTLLEVLEKASSRNGVKNGNPKPGITARRVRHPRRDPGGMLAIEEVNAHVRLDATKLELAQLVLRQLAIQDIRYRSLGNLDRWKARGVDSQVYQEWREILTNPDDRFLIKAMTSEDEDSNRLRQSPPFVGLLPRETDVVSNHG